VWRTALLVLCVLARGAAAEPHQVKIRAQTRIVLDRVRLLGDDQAEVRGQLVDGLTGDGLAHQAIAIQIGDETAHATTGPDGHFRIAVPRIATGPQAIDLAFRGSDLMEPAQLNQVTDPARAQVVLTIETADAPGGLGVTVRATADDHAVDLPIDLSVGPPTNGALKPLAQVKTGAAFLVTRKAAGGPGAHRIRADFAGDDTRQAAHVERSIELTAASVTTMTLSAARIAFEDDLVVTGKVTDEDGPPIHRAAVTLSSGDRRLAQGATAEDGSYRFRVEGEVLGQGQWGLQVSADPGRPSIRPSRSAPEIVRVSTPQPVPVSYTIAAFLATAAAAGGFFAARARPWNRLRRPAPPAEMPANGAQDEALDGGLVVARPGLVSTLRRASDEGFSGVVRDAVRGRPVADAVVRLERRSREDQDDKLEREARELHGTERTAITGPDGGFAFETLAMGDWSAAVTARGHVTETFTISIPHRGELRGVRVDLVPVRERVFQLYRRAAEPILPEARLWGVWSPRQIVDHIRSKRPSPALADLTDFIEEVYFSPRVCEESVLPTASERVDRAIHERAGTAS
jgi:carboxypeptidase family protein